MRGKARAGAARFLLGSALALSLALAAAVPARSGNPSHLNLAVNIQGIAAVTNLAAQTGSTLGSINLTWTEPQSGGVAPPLSYEIRVSTTGQISDTADFNAALPLSSFSSSPIPAPGPGGGQAGFVITGLSQANHCFAIRQKDSDAPQHLGVWLRDAGRSWNLGNCAVPLSPTPPFAVTDLAAVSGAVEGEVTLTWTAPTPPAPPLSSYILRFATFSVASLSGDTTAWFNLAAPNSLSVTPALSPGSAQAFTAAGLWPATTYYFAIKAVDSAGAVSPIDGRAGTGLQAQAKPLDLPPAVPSGLSASGGIKRVNLNWTDLGLSQKGLNFAFYKIYRSTSATTGFAPISTTTAAAFEDKPLSPFTTYHYLLSASDGFGGLESPPSSTAAAAAFVVAPLEPFGVTVSPSSTTVQFSWSPTILYEDGTPFLIPAAPATDELMGYRVMRSTDICAPYYTWISSVPLAVTTFTDTTNGNNYYYQLQSFNSFFNSTTTLVISSLGEYSYFADDCSSRLVLDQSQNQSLTQAASGLGADVYISRQRRPQDTGASVLQSVEFKPLLNGQTEIRDFRLPSPARIVLHFLTSAGAPVPQSLGAAARAASDGPAPSASGVKNLGMYWHNGAEFKKLYGRVDSTSQTVEVESPNLGVYQIRTLLRSDGAVFDVSNLSGRVITPNDDGLNDWLIFTYDPGPNNVLPAGQIYDLRGAAVSEMRPGLVPNTLVWDGKMNGRPVTSGIYVYQIKGDGKTFNGTVVIAR